MDIKSYKEYKNLIDTKFWEARKKRISRMSQEWGIWSAEMNRELKKQTESPGKYQVLYKYTFIYWILMSQLLELHYRGGLIVKFKIKKKIKEIREVEKVLDLKIKPKDMTQDDILKRILEIK